MKKTARPTISLAGILCMGFLTGAALLCAAPAKHAPRRIEVKMQDLKFNPNPVEISAGDTVVWLNDDEIEHSIKADDGSFSSDRISRGHSYEHKFEKAGKIPFHDELHPRMHGTVVVSSQSE